MSFTNQQIEQIHKLVGGLCERHVPAHVRDQIRMSYSIANHSVVILQARQARDPLSDWIEMEIAKLRYVAQRKEWKLYWKRASGKWWLYEPHTGSKSLEAMINEIEIDAEGCFFG